MLYSQESKYDAIAGQLVNRATGKPIPSDEPVFVLRAKDLLALVALRSYLEAIQEPTHREHVVNRVTQFEHFAAQHAQRMKLPDTTPVSADSDAKRHCATCQCDRINSPAFVPDNTRSRSWHGNAPNSPEEANKR